MASDHAFGNEAELAEDQLPAYAPMLQAFHRACAPALAAIIDQLPINEGMLVLDMASGDGFYSALLAQQVGVQGKVIAADCSPAYLKLAQTAIDATGMEELVSFEQVDIRQLPWPDNYVDLVWCAHSLYSLPEPQAVLAELTRITKPQGYVAILENDAIHHHVFPWPPEVELAIRNAQMLDIADQPIKLQKYELGRNLLSYLTDAGLVDCEMRSYTIDHQYPLSGDEQTFMHDYLVDLLQHVESQLEPALLAQVEQLINPEHPNSMFNQPSFYANHLELLALGRKPA